MMDLAELQTDINNAQHIVFLTGAGVSTHSGIPDYRSKNGIYDGVQESPETILSDSTLFNRPEFFHEFVMNNMYFPTAKPNLIHEKIAHFCNEKGNLITKKIYAMDTEAGNHDVRECHGNLYNSYCTKCHQPVCYEEYAKRCLHTGCGGIIRRGILSYRESIDPEGLNQSVEITQTS